MKCKECGGKLCREPIGRLPSERHYVCYGCGEHTKVESWADECYADEAPITNADAEMHEPALQTGCAGSR